MVGNPAELMAMLSAHGVVIGHIPGGIPNITAADIAGAIGMAHDDMAAQMLLGKYAMDGHAIGAFRDMWKARVRGVAARDGWGHPARSESLAVYTLAEWLDAQRCRSCKGVAHQMTAEGRVEPCPACSGIGLRVVGDRPVARALGLSNEGYRKSPWRARISWGRTELWRVEQAALGEVSRHLQSRQQKP